MKVNAVDLLKSKTFQCEDVKNAEKVLKIIEHFDNRYSFTESELEKEYSLREVFLASYVAYNLTDDNCHKSEFNNELHFCLARLGGNDKR